MVFYGVKIEIFFDFMVIRGIIYLFSVFFDFSFAELK